MKFYDFKGRKNVCGKKIRRIRKGLDLSQEDLAAKAQVAGLMLQRDSISRIERGDRIVADYELCVLAQVLEVTIDELIELPDGQ